MADHSVHLEPGTEVSYRVMDHGGRLRPDAVLYLGDERSGMFASDVASLHSLAEAAMAAARDLEIALVNDQGDGPTRDEIAEAREDAA